MVQKVQKTPQQQALIAFLLFVSVVGGLLAYNYPSQEKAEKKVMASGVVAQAKSTPIPVPTAVTEAKPVRAEKALATVSTPIPQTANDTSYLIRKGDTLTEIARRFCDEVPALAKRNSIRNPHRIKSGEIITIVNDCSPGGAKKYVSPEKFAVSGGASQEKQNPESSAKKISSGKKHRKISSDFPTIVPVLPKRDPKNCALASRGKRSEDMQTLAIHDCLMNHYGDIIELASTENNVRKNIIVSILMVESRGNPKAWLIDKVHGDSMGFMQMKIDTAGEYGVSRSRIFDPESSIRGGARVYADYFSKRYANGNQDRAISSYNRGPGTVERRIKSKKGFNPSTFPYVLKVNKVLHLLDTERKAS